MEGEPVRVERELQAVARGNGIRVMRAPLEELFIELVGGER
jgi:hypothetical protein